MALWADPAAGGVTALPLGCEKPTVGGKQGLMLTGHQDCAQAQGFAESKSTVALGGMEASLLSWSTRGPGAVEDVARLFRNQVICEPLGMAQSSLDKLCHCLWDPCSRNENPVGSPWRSQAGTEVSQSVLQDEMRQSSHLC